MKKILVSLLIATMAVTAFVGCGSKDEAPKEETQQEQTQEEGNTEGTTDESTEGTTDENTEGTTDENTEGTTDESTEGTADESTEGTTDENTEGTTDENTEENVTLEGAAGIVDTLAKEGFVRGATTLDQIFIEDTYAISFDNVESFGAVKTQMSPGPGFMMVLEAKDGQVDAVKAEMDKVLQAEIGAAFYPEEKEIAEKSEVKVNGNYVSLFILHTEVAADADAAYEELVK